MEGLSPKGSRQCADTLVSFAALPFPLKTPVTDGFTLAAGPGFLDGGNDSPARSNGTSKRTSKPEGNIPSVSFGWLALPMARPSCSLSSPVALPLVRLPSDMSPAPAPQPLNSPAFVNSSLTYGFLKSGISPAFSDFLAALSFSLEIVG